MNSLTARREHTAIRRQRTSFFAYFSLWRSRRALEQLDDAALKDVGLSAADAKAEAARPVWDVPAHWRR